MVTPTKRIVNTRVTAGRHGRPAASARGRWQHDKNRYMAQEIIFWSCWIQLAGVRQRGFSPSGGGI